MNLILISTDPSNASHVTSRIRDDLRRRFTNVSVVIFDHQVISATRLERLASIDQLILIVIINSSWTASNNQSVRPIDNYDGPIRTAIELATRLGLDIVPVLIGGANLASPDLSVRLCQIELSNCIEVRVGNEYGPDMDRLGRRLESLIAQGTLRQLRSDFHK